MAAKAAAEWASILNARGVPAGEVLTVPEILEHEQVVTRGLVKTFEDAPGIDRTVSVVRTGFRVADGDPAPNGPPPTLGADTDRLLEELGYDPAEIAKFEELASRWWDRSSEFKPLHDINPLRANYIDAASPVAGKQLVDVGCGGGILAEAVRETLAQGGG